MGTFTLTTRGSGEPKGISSITSYLPSLMNDPERTASPWEECMMASFLGAGMQDTLVRLGMHSIFQIAAWGPVGTDTVLVTDYI